MTASSRIQPGRFLLPSLRLLCLPHASQALRTLAQGERQARVIHAPVDIALLRGLDRALEPGPASVAARAFTA
jgi:hypothetical protein